MRAADLIALLSEMPEDAEVRIATQPSWPLAFELDGVASPANLAAETECDEHGYSCEECIDNVVWLTTGSHPEDRPYAPADAWAVADHA